MNNDSIIKKWWNRT